MIFRALLLLVTITGTLSFISCKSSDPTKKQPGKKVALFCTDQGAIRAHYEQEEGWVMKRGPVQLPDGVSCKDAEGQPESRLSDFPETGNWKVYYLKSEDLWQEGPFENGKRSGTWTFYDQDGNRAKTSQYSNGKRNGEEISYFSSGEWRAKGNYSDDKKTGRWQERNSPNSDCISEGSYGNGNKEGPWKECSTDKKTDQDYLSFEGLYRKGLRDGPGKLYYPNGEVFAEGSYRADIACLSNPPEKDESNCQKRTGEWTIYFENGNKRAIGSYDQTTGKRSGNWTEFYQSGEKMSSGQMNHTRYGMWTFFEKSGEIKGQYRFSGNDFVPKAAVIWENGKKVGEGPLAMGLIKYDEDNDKIEVKTTRKNGEWTEYYPNGQKKAVGNYKMDRKQGQWVYYNQSGQKTAEGKYNLGKKDGVWKEMEGGRMVTKTYRFGKVR